MKSSRHRDSTRGGAAAPDWAERMVRFLDDGFTVPGTSFRFGFDAIFGLVPPIGDLVTTASSVALLWVAWQRNLPYPVMARMLGNLAVDAIVGAIPVLGDLFDFVFKANRRNLDLIEQYSGGKREVTRNARVFLILLAAGVVAILVTSIVLSVLILRVLLS